MLKGLLDLNIYFSQLASYFELINQALFNLTQPTLTQHGLLVGRGASSHQASGLHHHRGHRCQPTIDGTRATKRAAATGELATGGRLVVFG